MTQTINSDPPENTLLYRQADPTDTAPEVPSPFRNLVFPLNVYAHAMLLQEGKAAYLHYGLFQDDQAGLQAAQQYSTDLLTVRLPSPPCRILEVGVGLGATISLLNQRGYAIQGITPDAGQIAYIRQTLGAQAPVSCQSLEDFEAQRESFNVVLFQESAQYIEPMVIFDKASDLLPPAGDLFVLDEFTLKHDETGTVGLHYLSHFIALAIRFGFDLIEHKDLSLLAAPTLAYLLKIIDTHRNRLIQDLPVSKEQLDRLNASNRVYQQKYASGHYGYALLHFRKTKKPVWRLSMLESEQISHMRGLFEKTFNQQMSSTFWQWKYPENSGREIGIWRENHLAGHYGGIGREILFFGQPQTAVQIGDVMVDTKERGALTRKGPFFLMAATFLERYIGFGRQFLIGFGFPNDRAMKVAEHLKLYAEVGRMAEISWRPRTKFPLWKTRLHTLNRDQADVAATVVNDCWQRMSADFRNAIIGIRDWPYLQHRYLNHPHQPYQIVLIKNRFNAKTRGILVLRYDHGDCEIIDIIAPLVEIPLLITHARRLARIHGAKRVFCQITENFAAHFAATGGNQVPVNIRIPANIWSNGPSVETLKDRWWLMSGDKDFR